MGNGQKKIVQKLNSFFWLSGRSGNAPFKSGGEKTFQPAKSFFFTHSDILLWPHSIWLRVRVAQCAIRYTDRQIDRWIGR